MSSNEQMLQVRRLQAKLEAAEAKVDLAGAALQIEIGKRRAAEAQVAAVRALADEPYGGTIHGDVVLVRAILAALSSSEGGQWTHGGSWAHDNEDNIDEEDGDD